MLNYNIINQEGDTMEAVTYLVDICTYYLSRLGLLGGFTLVLLEAIIPALPLSVFVALNVNTFGLLSGTLISWIGTCVGCYLCYLFFYHISHKIVYKYLSDKMKERVEKAEKHFRDISISKLVLLITLPFMPSFFINFVSGLSGVSKEKFFVSLMIGKIFMVIFWGYIGKSFLESMTDIKTIIYIIVALILAYIISKIVGKKMNIE